MRPELDPPSVPPVPAGSGEPPLRGIDLARRALEDAKAAAKAKGKSATTQSGKGKGAGRGGAGGISGGRGNRRTWSGAGPDERDPQPLGRLTSSIADRRGWSENVMHGTVFGCWPTVVGEEIASHAQPVSLNEGVLSVTAESTAWATQLRLMQHQVLIRIAATVGHGVVRQLRITGPTAPNWRKGELHVRGRGPRDTYG
jgi:predicted nucleic acid-binding Zn ribbon protein